MVHGRIIIPGHISNLGSWAQDLLTTTSLPSGAMHTFVRCAKRCRFYGCRLQTTNNGYLYEYICHYSLNCSQLYSFGCLSYMLLLCLAHHKACRFEIFWNGLMTPSGNRASAMSGIFRDITNASSLDAEVRILMIDGE